MTKRKDEFEFYDDEYFDKAKEKKERLRELEEREFYLRNEKSRILKEQPWFRKPQNLIAVFAVLLPIIVSFFISIYSEDKKEITIEYSELEPLIVESSSFGNKVSIKYDSVEIKNISKLKFKIINSGNLDVEKKDFIDGPLKIVLSDSDNTEKVNIYKILNIDDAGQQNSLLKFDTFNKISSFTYLPSLLNAGDEVIIDAYLIDPSKFNISMSGKIKNGKIIGPIISKKDEFNIGYKTLILSINSFFKYKWLSIIIFVILFFITALSSIFILSMQEDPKWLTNIMGLTIGVVAIFQIIIIISTLIY
jgi:hypothetical protein